MYSVEIVPLILLAALLPVHSNSCKNWCAAHSLKWTKKCEWAECSWCPECSGVTSCPSGYVYWGQHLLTFNCGSGCTIDYKEHCVKCVCTNATATTTVGKVCLKWCSWHVQTWKVKCRWTDSCEGCPECFGERFLVHIAIFQLLMVLLIACPANSPFLFHSFKLRSFTCCCMHDV